MLTRSLLSLRGIVNSPSPTVACSLSTQCSSLCSQVPRAERLRVRLQFQLARRISIQINSRTLAKVECCFIQPTNATYITRSRALRLRLGRTGLCLSLQALSHNSMEASSVLVDRSSTAPLSLVDLFDTVTGTRNEQPQPSIGDLIQPIRPIGPYLELSASSSGTGYRVDHHPCIVLKCDSMGKAEVLVCRSFKNSSTPEQKVHSIDIIEENTRERLLPFHFCEPTPLFPPPEGFGEPLVMEKGFRWKFPTWVFALSPVGRPKISTERQVAGHQYIGLLQLAAQGRSTSEVFNILMAIADADVPP